MACLAVANGHSGNSHIPGATNEAKAQNCCFDRYNSPVPSMADMGLILCVISKQAHQKCFLPCKELFL